MRRASTCSSPRGSVAMISYRPGKRTNNDLLVMRIPEIGIGRIHLRSRVGRIVMGTVVRAVVRAMV